MKIAILDVCTITQGDVSLNPIRALGDTVEYDVVPAEQVPDAIGDADAVIVNKAEITEMVMDACPNLSYVGLFATGYNNIDIKAADKRGITVCNVPGYSTDSVAQLTIAMILNFACSMVQYNESTHRGDWTRMNRFSYLGHPIMELRGKTLGVYGYGAIGRRVADIGEVLGMEVIVYARTRPKECRFEVVTKDEIFSRSDFLTFHCPLNDDSRGIVNRESLSLMKPTAFLINTARGGLIAEQELADALREGVIAGAGIDVLTVEPMTPGHAYLTAPNMIITPHVAWASLEARQRLVTKVAETLSAFMRGQPINTVNGK